MTARQPHRAQPFRGWKTADPYQRTIADIVGDLAFDDTFWQADALCRETDTELFFDDPDAPTSLEDARRVCGMCPVRERCLEWALSFPWDKDEHGIFGGVGPRIRRDMRTARSQVVAA